MPESAPAIELIDADIPRGRSPALVATLQDVRWRIDCGEFWAVGAAPGTGKTDLLCTAAALQRPLKGFHLIFGRDTREMGEEELVVSHQKVAMVFEGGRLFPHLTVAENLLLPLAYHSGERRTVLAERVDRILEATGLAEARGRRPLQLTRSLHQRVGLARALVLQPDVLLIDNPLAGLDARQGRWWLEFLGQINRGHAIMEGRQLTIAVASDDFRPWLETAGRFAFIKEQRLEIAGSREDLRQSRESAVQDLLSSAFGP
jgi:ABC-type transporter Mla maintaining outer membrane lipid asymmetry ATPase subunit MlaF